jgi:putative DNA methylase
MTTPIKTPKKLIEVALPLDDINTACAYEKMPGIGAHPRGIHLWWARRPLAAARAVLFAQMVNDPGYERNLGRGVNKERAKIERERLFKLIRGLVKWENTNNIELLEEARVEILKSWRETCELNKGHPQAKEIFNPDLLPGFHDPFSGGGALPLEAQRLGLTSFASDLNPVAVLINKSMIQVPPRFIDRSPVGPIPANQKQAKIVQDWSGTKGLAEDIRRYGSWLRDEAFKAVADLYPKVELPKAYGGGKANVIAWLWARTVKSPNPAFSHVDVPLISTYILANKDGKEAYLEPVISGGSYTFKVKNGKPPKAAADGTKASGRGANFVCLMSGTPIGGDYIKAEGLAGRIGSKLMAVVAEVKGGRVYLSPTDEVEQVAKSAKAQWVPGGEIPAKLSGGTCVPYGMTQWGDLFTQRQLVGLNSFVEQLSIARTRIRSDAIAAKWVDDGKSLVEGGMGATAYADALTIYLAFAIDRCADFSNTCTRWVPGNQKVMNLFAKQSIAMTWDYPEANIMIDTVGGYVPAANYVADCVEMLPIKATIGDVAQADAAISVRSEGKVISTDPPYYDNIYYADLSDFFYVWLRRSLRPVLPDLFSSMVVPKAEELVATAHRHGGKEQAEEFFLDGMTKAMRRLSEQAHLAFPTTIYYAFKQSQTTDLGTGNTGWETFLEAVIRAGFAISGTWPMRSEQEFRMVGQGVNALASSIVLVCRKREANAPTSSRREFIRELKDELKEAVEAMIGGAEGVSPVAPVDLAQAVIGPGMAVFSKYSAVLEADGSPMTVHAALTIINGILTEGGDEFDANTQFCLVWFDEQSWTAGDFGKADVLARAKGTSVNGLRDSGVVEAGSGNVRLLKPNEYPKDWIAENDNNTPVWEALHQMIRALRDAGESAAGTLLAGMPQRADPIRNLAYRLYTLCERKGWADEARSYNELITSWTGIEAASHEKGHLGSQANLDI